MDVENTINTVICEDAFEDKMNENVVKTEEASKHANQKIDVDVENIVDPEICKEVFKDKINENIAKTEDASKHANEKI